MTADSDETLVRGFTNSTSALAAFVSGLRYEHLPSEVVDHAELCVLDTVGCGLFGSTLPWARIVFDTASELAAAGGTSSSGLAWGHHRWLPAPDAALVNGTAVHGFELDDLHARSIVHPGSVVLPAALAVSAHRPVTGRDLLTAVIAGYEVAARVGMSVGAAHLLAGWHPTGTHGTIAAAAAAGKVLDLPAGQLAEALGTAGSQSSGLMAAQYESMVKRLHAGRASQSGVWSALLAKRGFTGIHDLFESDYGGYCKTFSPAYDASRLTAGLGEVWETLNVGFKPYSTNGSCHPSIDCIRELQAEHGLTAAQVAKVDIDVSTATAQHVGWPYRPNSVTTAQMNLPYIIAAVLTDGNAFISQFTVERINDPRLVELASRVTVLAAADIDARGDGARHLTRVRVTTVDGRQLPTERSYARGSAREPLSALDVEKKFLRLATTVLPEVQAGTLGECARSLHRAPDLSQLLELLTSRKAVE